MKTPSEIKKALECCRGTYCPKECPYYDECMNGSDVVITDFKEYVQQLESQVPKWIPVTERLPEDYHDVLVSVGEMVDVGFHHHRYGWECYSCKKRNDVTHWMPLPSAPEDIHAYKLVHRDPVPDKAIIVEEVSE